MFGQYNLVKNYSFEINDSCPSLSTYTDGSISYCHDWFQPNLAINSSDYFNSCVTDTEFLGAPYNYYGFQQGRTGNAYGGIYLGSLSAGGDVGREYLEGELNDSLTGGKKYLVKFYVSLPNKVRIPCDAMALYLSNSPLLYTDSLMHRIPVTPQVSNPTNNILTDTTSWMEISDTIIANGGEKYLTIGNFVPDSQIHSVTYNYPTPQLMSYYFIDDVYVIPVDSLLTSISDRDLSSNEVKFVNGEGGLMLYFNHSFEGWVTLYDIAGRPVENRHATNETSINLSTDALQEGLYIISLVDDKKSTRLTYKIVLQ